jgi:hypothetical protein
MFQEEINYAVLEGVVGPLFAVEFGWFSEPASAMVMHGSAAPALRPAMRISVDEDVHRRSDAVADANARPA